MERGVAETLADEWVLLFTTNCNKPITDRSFKDRYQDIDKQVKKLSDQEKAIFTRIIHRGIKDVVDTLLGDANDKKTPQIKIAAPRPR